MSYEAINAIIQAEAQARATVEAAEQRAEQLVAEARAAGELAVEAAIKKADAELVELGRQIEERSKAYAQELSAGLEKDAQALRRRAGYRLERAAALVVERIVEG